MATTYEFTKSALYTFSDDEVLALTALDDPVLTTQALFLVLPFPNAPSRTSIENMIGEPQFSVESLFPTFTETCESVQRMSNNINDILTKVSDTFSNFIAPVKMKLIVFVFNQIYLVQDNITVPRFFSFLLSIFLYMGKSTAEYITIFKKIIAVCSEEEKPQAFSMEKSLAALVHGGMTMKGETQNGINEMIEGALSAASDNVSLITGGLTLLLTTILGISCDFTTLSKLMRKIKTTGDGLVSVNSWMQYILDFIVNQYYQYIYGCSKKEMELYNLIPEFKKYQKLVYTLLSIPNSKFLESKYLCEKVKETYKLGQSIASKMTSRDKNLARELSYVFSNVERKFMPLYESVKSSPLFMNISRQRPRTVYFYGPPGVGKSNLINFFAVHIAKTLYPDREFNGENSVMFSRRIENEYFDGYAHQPIVQYDDFLQAVDSRTNPNMEIRELIYMVNDAPYHLHMSDIREKKDVYFDSEHVVVSTNVRVPQVHSIHDVGALKRRFDIAVEVRVKPEYGQLKRINNANVMIVDPSKTKSELDMDIYELHAYSLFDGTPLVEPGTGTPIILNYQQFFDSYIEHCRSAKRNAANVRKIIYEQLGVTIKEENYQELFDEENDKPANGETQIELNSIWSDFFYQGSEQEFEEPVEDEFTIDADIEKYLEQEPEPYSTPCDENDEDDLTNFEDKEPSKSYMQKIKAKISELYQNQTKCFQSVMTKIFGKIKDIYSRIKSGNCLKMLGAISVVGLTLLYLFYPKNNGGCKLSKVTNHIFKDVCKRNCETCDYLKSVCGSTISFNDVSGMKMNLAFWNKRAADILARDNLEYKEVSNYWDKYMSDLQGEPQYMRTPGRRRTAKVESYGRSTAVAGGVENYGRDMTTACKTENYGREPTVSGEVQVGMNVDVNSLLGASEQYISVVMRNCVDVITPRFNGKGLFVQGRMMIINKHYADMIKRTPGFEIRNPTHFEGTEVRTDECRFVDIYRDGHPQDLTLVGLPKFIPCRPNIMNKIISPQQQALIVDAGATLVGFRKIQDTQTFTETHFPSLGIMNIRSEQPGGGVYSLRKAYCYDAATKPGDCGMLLFTHSNRASGKLIGFHASGNRQRATGFAEALNTKSLQAAIDEMEPHHTVAPVMPDSSYVSSPQFLELGDTIHIGDADYVVGSSPRTEIRPSPLNNILAKPKCKPAHLTPFTKPSGETVDPFTKGLNKVTNIQKRLDPKILDLAFRDTKRTILKHNAQPRYGVLTYKQAIEGVEGDNMMSSINRKTSPGYPWVAQKKTQLAGKKEWLNQIIDGEVTDLYNLENQELKKAVEDRIDQAKRNIRTPAVYIATLKDERRPINKVDEGKTRVFTAAPQDYLIAMRQYFLDFIASTQDNRVMNEIAVGIDHNSEWPYLHHWLQGYGDNNIAGDFSNFDGSLLAEVMWKIVEIINDWYDDSPENRRVRDVLFEEIANSYVYCKGHIIQWTHSQPSGNPMTVIINSMFQMIMFRYVYLSLKHQNNIPMVCDFRQNVRMVTYGDDGILSVKSGITSWFNQESVTAEFARVGLTYTDEAKTGNQYLTRSINQISFLKRKFLFVDGTWQGALDKDVIYEMCMWTKKNFPIEEVVSNCCVALMEATNHGYDFYEEFARELEVACDRANIDIDIYDYDEMQLIKFDRFY